MTQTPAVCVRHRHQAQMYRSDTLHVCIASDVSLRSYNIPVMIPGARHLTCGIYKDHYDSVSCNVSRTTRFCASASWLRYLCCFMVGSCIHFRYNIPNTHHIINDN